MAAYDDLNAKRIFSVSIISILVTIITVLAVQVMYFAMADIVDTRKVNSASYTRQNKRLAAQAEELQQFGVDEETGKIFIPVKDVMKKMATEAKPDDHGATDEA